MPRHRIAKRSGRTATAVLAVVVAAAVAVIALGGAPPAAGQLPGTGDIPAPATWLSPDGLSATDGVRTLAVSQADGLDPAGQVVTVSGWGFDEFKGIYVAFCVIPPTNQVPSPCGGGADLSGTGGASQWISSNPPSYGEGLAIPYGPGGSFDVSLSVSPAISASLDCRRVRCAIVSRNDHVRTTDRSQDIFIPVTFAEPVVVEEPPPVDEPVVPPPTSPPPTEAPVVEETVPPETTAAPATTTTSPTTSTTVPEADEMAAASATSEPSGGLGAGWIALIVVAVVAVVGAVLWATLVRRPKSTP